MKNKEILQSAIVKAIENGLDEEMKIEMREKDFTSYGFMIVIFSHEFAKAFWGEEVVGECNLPIWAYHLRIIVLENNPIKYLEQFLK